jgi:hypothetical protein
MLCAASGIAGERKVHKTSQPHNNNNNSSSSSSSNSHNNAPDKLVEVGGQAQQLLLQRSDKADQLNGGNAVRRQVVVTHGLCTVRETLLCL